SQLGTTALAGANNVDATALQSGATALTLNCAPSLHDALPSYGNDTVTGRRGDDLALMGAGDDTFIWNPGDGSDTVEGQAGKDTLQLNGANIAEKHDISANGSRVRFTRDVANIVMDLNGVERIDFNALGGADTITVNDLSGTDVSEVNLNLAAAGGGGDGQADAVIVNGTAGNDTIAI